MSPRFSLSLELRIASAVGGPELHLSLCLSRFVRSSRLTITLPPTPPSISFPPKQLPTMGDDTGMTKAVPDPASKKRARRLDDYEGGDLKRVAEIVMVLSAMGQMRGGKDPTPVEKGLAAEAREKLLGICESLKPSDLFTSDAARVVAGDLGFNSMKDPMGNRSIRKTSIAEKVMLTKKKMEEAKESTTQSPLVPGGFGAKPENRNTLLHGSHRLFPDKPGQAPVMTAGGYSTGSPSAHSSTLGSATTFKQTHFISSEIPQTTSPLKPSSSPLQKDSSLSTPARADAAHFRLDARSAGPSHLQQVQGNSSGNRILEKTSTVSSMPSASTAATKPTQVTKLIDHTPAKVESNYAVKPFQTSTQVPKDQDSKSPTIQAAQGNMYIVQQPSYSVNLVHATSITSHNEIARSVQNFLQPKPIDLPGWTPPSVDYMTKPLNCQVCKLSITDLESLLVCDACEKGVHLKCLKSFTQRAVSNIEWHCPKCLLSSNGKPLPPKYGKVTRNIVVPKPSSNTGGALASSEKRTESLDSKANNQKPTANANPSSSNPSCAGTPSAANHIESIPDGKMLNAAEMQAKDSSMSTAEKDGELSKGTCIDHSNEKAVAHNQSSGQCSVDNGLRSLEPKVESNHNTVELPTDIKVYHQSRSPNVIQVGYGAEVPFDDRVPNNSQHEINKCKDEELKIVSGSRGTTIPNASNEIGHETRVNSLLNSTTDSWDEDCKMIQSGDLHSVEWVGDILSNIDEKSFYQSCRINGQVYTLQDYVLVLSGGQNFSPSKLQVLWEEKDGTKWATVHKCYLPTDLPEVVIRPSAPENNEVYESNDASTIEAGRIHAPCVALPLMTFKEETERKPSSRERNDSCPVFLCRWFYDKSKALFQPITD